MLYSESSPGRSSNISSMHNSNNEDENTNMPPDSSQFLHKIIVNDDEELPFKHVVSVVFLEIYVNLNDLNCYLSYSYECALYL